MSTNERFAEIFRHRYAELVRLAAAITGDRTEAEDIAQETLGKLASHAVLTRPDGEVTAWLRRVCLNASFNRVRDERRRRQRLERAARLEESGRWPETTGGPLLAVLQAEEHEAVRAALARLPERQCACLMLRHGGYRYQEIAEALGIATGSVGVLLARGERAFRRHYKGDQHEDLS